MKLSIILLLTATLQASGIPTIAGAMSIAASSGTIIREGHDLITHFKTTMRKHGTDLKKAFQGKPAAPPNPVNVPVAQWPPNVQPVGATGAEK